jgi:hypothetical protein
VIGYLLVRAFLSFSHEEKVSADKHAEGNKDKASQKKVSKEIGEYIDYEEIKKK